MSALIKKIGYKQTDSHMHSENEMDDEYYLRILGKTHLKNLGI